MNDIIIEDQTFKGKDFSSEKLPKGSYENCEFINCIFSKVNLSDYNFLECIFDQCDLKYDQYNKNHI